MWNVWTNSLNCEIGAAWTRTVAPTEEPVSEEEAKDHARITGSASDESVARHIAAAREAAEDYMSRGLMTQTWKVLFDAFADIMPLPMAAPLQSVTSVKYYDVNGAQQTLATSVYDTDTVSRPGRVVLKVDQSWPSTQTLRKNGTVEIVYVVGWPSPDLVPERIKQGIRQYMTYLDLNRDGTDATALAAKQAAERCWDDRISWTPPRYGE